MNEAYDMAKSMVFYRIDNANKTEGNTIIYDMATDIPLGMVRSVTGLLANDLRKLGYKVRVVKGTLVVSWDAEV